MKNKYKIGKKGIQLGGDGELSSTSTNPNTTATQSVQGDGSKPNGYVPVKSLPYDVQIFSLLCIVGILAKLILGQVTTDTATATVYGYGFGVLSLLGLIMTSFAISSKDPASRSFIGFFTVIIKNALPIILTIIVVSLVLAQNILFYKQINDGRVTDEYKQFSGISSFFVVVQCVLVIKYLTNILLGEQRKEAGLSGRIMATLSSEISSIVWILSIINIGIVGILQVILKYFSTDG